MVVAQRWVGTQVSVDVLVLIEEPIQFCGLLVRQVRSGIRGSSVCVDTVCDFPRLEPIVPVHEERRIFGELSPHLRVFVTEIPQIPVVIEILLVIHQGRVLSEVLVDVLVVVKELIDLVAVAILISVRKVSVAVLIWSRVLCIGIAIAVLISIRVAICRISILGVGCTCVPIAVLVLIPGWLRLPRIEPVLPLHEKRGILRELIPHIRMIVKERPKILVLIEIRFVVCQGRIRS